MKTLIFSVLYFLIAILFISVHGQQYIFPEFILKALLMPVLILIFLVNSIPGKISGGWILLAGLILSWAGDLFLQVPQDIKDMFIPGLASFLLAHIMYLTLFYRTPGENTLLRKRTYLLIPVLLFGLILVSVLYNDLDGMRFPVILYAVVILTMLTAAMTRFKKVNEVSYYMVLAGAILFVISDSAIAINKFSIPFKYSSVVIMFTYVIAQFLIVTGYIKQFRINFT